MVLKPWRSALASLSKREMGTLFKARWSVLVVLALAGHAQAEEKAQVKVIKYPELARTVKQLKGKVIVIDFWAEW